MRTSNEVEELCRKLKPVIGSKANTLWYYYLAEDDKGRKELALDIEIIAEKILKKEALASQKILLNPPSQDDSNGSYLLGDVIYNDKALHPLHLRQNDFTKQVGIFAVTGEGKTNLAYHLALQLLQKKVPFMVIDWKRSWRNLLTMQDKIPELKDVQVYTVGRDILPFLWNPFRPPPGANKELWISTISEVLEKSHLSGPGVAYYFNKVYSKLLKGQDDSFYPNFFDGKKDLENLRAYERELRWKQTALRIFNSFITGPASKAFNARNPIKLEDLLGKPVILELDLEMPKPLRVFFSEIILRWIHHYRLSQGETENLRHVLFLEEAHNLFTESPFNKESGSLENIYREIRAFGQGIVSITQHPSLLPIYLLGNCHTQIYLGLQHADDIRTAKKSLFLTRDEESYPNMLNIGECIVKIKNRIEPCLVKTPLVPVKKELVNDDWLKVHHLSCLFWKYAWKDSKDSPEYLHLKRNVSNILSNKHFSNTQGYLKTQFKANTPVSGFNKGNIISKHGLKSTDIYKARKSKYPLNTSPDKLLADIFLRPFSSITQRYKRLNLNSDYGNNLKNKLVREKCIRSKKIITGKGWITLFDLAQKGRLVLRDLGYEAVITREGIAHKYWKYKIAEYYKNKSQKGLG